MASARLTPAIAPGATLSLSWDLINNGSSVAGDVEYGYYISRGPIPTAYDYLIPFSGPVDAAGLKVLSGVKSGNNGLQMDSMTIPSSFPPGVYSIAVIIDPLDKYPETQKQNNTAVSTNPLVLICQAPPTISGPGGNDMLPGGSSGLYYQGVLTAACGDGTYTYSVADGGGALPVGLSLNAKTGIITGVPERDGATPDMFDVQVTDGRGNAPAAHSFSHQHRRLQRTAGHRHDRASRRQLRRVLHRSSYRARGSAARTSGAVRAPTSPARGASRRRCKASCLRASCCPPTASCRAFRREAAPPRSRCRSTIRLG